MKYFTRLAPFALAALPFAASAQGVILDPNGTATSFLGNIVLFSNGVLIPFILGIAFLVFVWGMFRYFIAGGADEGARENGKNLMIYATLGFVLIIILWGVVNLLADSSGFAGQTLNYTVNTPTI
ncbi:hypothetical protein KC887_07110 [Candidatus Kaiserbacteria bacterium]|nr:hypothetical protein [Candidatus Kaiserbacteria bacterium]